MAKDRLSGKLAVILHADIVGSTALVHQDEQLAHQRIQDTFRRFGDTVSKYYGQVRELRGDALLAEFERASDAVTAALAFQAEQKKYNAQLDDPLQPAVRVGIAMGEVVIADNTITGTGVVLAQRLEQLADAGGVVIQGAAYETIPGRFPFEFVNLGEHAAKGFDEPVRVFSANLKAGSEIPLPDSVTHKMRNSIIAFVSLAVVIVAVALVWVKPWEKREEPASLERMAFPLPSRPSIAILAFDNLSGDPDQEYLSDGISEGIIRELSRFPQLFVIARNSSFIYKGQPVKIQKVSEELGVRYVVEGSMQSTADQIRVTAQLIDATTGKHLWSDRYDGKRQDFFVVQDDITQKIVSTLAGRVELVERGRVLNNPAERLQAYEYVQQGWAQWYEWTREANDRAGELYEKAIQLDPDYAEAYVGLTFVNINDMGFSSSGLTAEESLDLAFKMAQKAIEINPHYYRSHLALANVYMRRGNLTQAIAEYEKALELNPNATKVLASAAEVLVKLGRAEEAIVQIKLAIRLNPYHPDWYLWNLGWAQYFAGDHEEALTSIRRMRNPPNAVKRTLAAILARLGRLEESRTLGAEFLQKEPAYNSEEFVNSWYFRDRSYQDKLVEDLRKAGLFEKPPTLLSEKPSIAVLPFTNMSDDPNQEYFSDGIAEDIITDLSQLKNLVVIARNSSFTYRNKSKKVQDIGKDLGVKFLLEGSVRKAGDRIRIAVQLIDTSNGHHLWGERFDRKLTNMFALQDEITERIVSALSVQLSGDEKQQLANNATKSFEAYDLFRQAQIVGASFTKAGYAQAAETYRRSISVDPKFARAYGALAVVLTRQVNAGYSDVPAETKERSLELARKAVSINPDSPQAQWSLGYVYLYRRQLSEAVAALERAISLSPSYADGYALLALIKNEMGQAEEAIRLIEKGMYLNPHYSWDYLYNLGRANYALGHYERAVGYLQQALDRNEFPGQPRLFLLASFVRLGQQDDAEWEVIQLEMFHPEFTLSHLQTIFPMTDNELWGKFVSDLKAAGLPE